jgi:hypothetical protein
MRFRAHLEHNFQGVHRNDKYLTKSTEKMKHTLHLEGMFFRESYGFLYY